MVLPSNTKEVVFMKPITLVRSDSKKQEQLNSLSERHETLKGRIAELTIELEQVKDDLHSLLDSSGGNSIATNEFSVARSFVSRENFALSKARPILGELLTPYISMTNYRTLRIQQKVVESFVGKKAA